METVEYKYPIKTKVFYLEMESTPTFDTCPSCLGDGKLLRVNSTFTTCQTCKGEKVISSGGRIEEVVKSGKVKRIFIDIDKNGTDIVYNLKNVERDFGQSQLFLTEEDAEEDAEATKSKGIMGYASSQGNT